MARYSLKALLAHSSDTPSYLFVNSDGRVCVRDEAGRERLVAPITQTTMLDPRVDGEPTRPTETAHGVSLHWHFKLGDLMYFETAFEQYRDETADVVLVVGWIADGTQSGKKVKWQFDVLPISDGDNIYGDPALTDTVEDDVPATAGIHRSSTLTIPAAYCVGKTELLFRLTRIASTADPDDDPGVMHVQMIETLA